MKYFTLLILTFTISISSFSNQYSISGYVRDAKTNESLIGVNVFDKNTLKGTITNNFGYYSISFNENERINLIVSYVGYQKQDTVLILTSDLQINFALTDNNELGEVIVHDSYKKIEEKIQMSELEIPLQQIRMLPSLSGEADIMRAFQLMPGVQSGKEGTSSIYVRGGSPDQNLFLLDDVPLYYVSHIGGFVSVFEPAALKKVKLIKGGFPARYGGRLSSVVDIRMKDGNNEKLHGEYTLGILSSKLILEGPVKKDTSAFLFSIRRCNIDLVTRPISWFDSNGESYAGYTFYDINAKFNRIINNANRIYFSFYTGRDRIFVNARDYSTIESPDSKYKYKNTIGWGNLMGTIRLNHIINPKLFSNSTLSFTKFNYLTKLQYKEINLTDNTISANGKAEFNSGVDDIIAKTDFDYFLNNKNKIKFGGTYTYHFFTPGINSFKMSNEYQEQTDTTYGSGRLNAGDYDAYFEDEVKLTKKLNANIGLHFSLYSVHKSYFYSLQPRLSFNYLVKENFAVKLSYAEMQQSIHLLSNSGAGLPTDLWVPATEMVKPEKSKQLAIGIAHTLPIKKTIELSIESFYKTMDGLIEYKEGSSYFSGNSNWEDKVVKNGTGTVYGIEFLIQKKEGLTTGWIAYTLSKNDRQFEDLNNGKTFPYKYDRRHDIAIVVNHEINENISFSATWVYGTGNAITLAVYQYDLINFNYNTGLNEYSIAHIYNGRNSSRMPSYHKMDIGFNFVKKFRRGTRTWNIGVYNVYNRKNPYFLYYKKNKQKEIKLYGLSLFPIIPSFSYNYKF